MTLPFKTPSEMTPQEIQEFQKFQEMETEEQKRLGIQPHKMTQEQLSNPHKSVQQEIKKFPQVTFINQNQTNQN